MYGLVPTTLALTVALSAAAFMVTIFHLGAGFLLYLAAPGDAAIWLLPVHVATALPAALFGGALLAASGPRTSDGRPAPQEIATLVLLVTVASVMLVGWVMPAGYRASSAAMDRFQERRVEGLAEAPASFDLDRLLADPSAAAREELQARVRVIAPCLVLGLIAWLLVASPLSCRWRWVPRCSHSCGRSNTSWGGLTSSRGARARSSRVALISYSAWDA